MERLFSRFYGGQGEGGRRDSLFARVNSQIASLPVEAPAFMRGKGDAVHESRFSAGRAEALDARGGCIPSDKSEGFHPKPCGSPSTEPNAPDFADEKRMANRENEKSRFFVRRGGLRMTD